jgi:FMN-dependent NADH-azoreductase
MAQGGAAERRVGARHVAPTNGPACVSAQEREAQRTDWWSQARLGVSYGVVRRFPMWSGAVASCTKMWLDVA